MTDKVDQFLSEHCGNNFAELTPRPPVPGEENEKESNGGMSTRSSGSHKSQLSHTSGRSINSGKGEVNPATPRKSNIDKTNLSCAVKGYSDMDAPLGFEPEGSAANSPPFTENSTPPYIKWAETLYHLLNDCEGVILFKTFLEQEGIGKCCVDFWFLCQGLKQQSKTEAEQLQLIKAMNKKYIKSDKLPFLNSNTKRIISERLVQSNVTDSIFNDAQAEVEEYMKNDTYPLFLKSDLYVQYVSREGESPKSSNSSSGSNSARPMSSGPLPTVKEDQELQPGDFAVPFSVCGPPASKSISSQKSHLDSKREDHYRPYSSYLPRSVQPFHVSYAPTSAIDSEIQSLSSQDTHTDDTHSLTDSSVDGRSYRESRRHKNKMSRRYQNKETGIFIPRTERAPKDRNIAETNPEVFAALLISKLDIVFKQRQSDERMQQSLSKVMNQSDISESMDKTCMSTASSRNNTTATSLGPLLASSMIEDDNPDSILEEHCSRIGWDESAHDTPSRSPGRSKSPSRNIRKSLSQTQPHTGTSSMPGTLQTKSLHNRKKTEFSMSMSSFDSGVGEDNKCFETHKHIHHHHHHHHDRGRKSKHKYENYAQERSWCCAADGAQQQRAHSYSGTTRQKSRASHSDACSNLDSGISMVESVGQSQPEVVLPDPSTSKVLQWILDNENMNRGTSSAYTDSDKTSSTYKRSHKSALNPAPPQQYKQSSTSKKGSSSSGNINRSASADSGARVPWVGGAMGVMPSQPIVQDPSMPLMPPPNTMVQLEEVNRRLGEQNHNKTVPVKSKSFTGVPNKDKQRPTGSVPMGSSQRVPSIPSAKTVPSDLDTSAESTSRSEKRTSKKSPGSGNASTSSKPDETIIGYYFCGEPIPYRITVQQPSVTLGQLKQLISKRGTFRYFVKTYSKDFDTEAVYEEVKEDSRILPVFEGKVVVKVDRID